MSRSSSFSGGGAKEKADDDLVHVVVGDDELERLLEMETTRTTRTPAADRSSSNNMSRTNSLQNRNCSSPGMNGQSSTTRGRGGGGRMMMMMADEATTTTITSSSVFAPARRLATARRISCWLASLLAMVALSLVFNLFEGSLITSLFAPLSAGSVQDRPPVAAAAAANDDDLQAAAHNDGVTAAANRIPPFPSSPTAAPTAATKLSVHEHKKMIAAASTAALNNNNNNNTNAMSSYYDYNSTNSFTTWLDFDEIRDPPKRQQAPKASDGTAFATRWCDLTGTKWYPDDENDDDAWQLRAPAFLLPGAAYSGTVYMAAALHQHPGVLPARTKELQFFHEKPFRRYVNAANEQTLVRAARQRMYARDYATTTLQSNTSVVSFDASPGYLFFSSLLPRRILCVEPWVKLVVMLRNPVDRVLEHYAASRKRGLKLSLEDWIDREFALMERVKLIPPGAANATTGGGGEDWSSKIPNAKEEDVAWYEYQTASVDGAIGRSMYVIQLRQWFQAFRYAGRNPVDAVLVVRTDHVAANPAVEYNRILDFLNLPPHQLHNLRLPVAVTHQTRPVQAATRQRLEDFFVPYNRRLKRLLRTYGMSASAEDDDANNKDARF